MGMTLTFERTSKRALNEVSVSQEVATFAEKLGVQFYGEGYMAGKRIVFIPFEGGVSADTPLTNTVESYQAKYPNCTVVEWPYGVKAGFFSSWSGDSSDWSSNPEKSPLGNVNVEEDVIIVVGHGSFLRSDIGVKTGTTKLGLV
jgi:hypothetical protein